MNKLKHFFLSRNTILALIVLILGSILLSYLLPQQFTTALADLQDWQSAHPVWSSWVAFAGLDHLYATPWFAVLLFLFLLSLTLSAYEQVKRAVQQTFSGSAPSGGRLVTVQTSEADLRAALKNLGYLRVYDDASRSRFIKHPWGFWGSALLHIGIAFVIASSLFIVVTERRGLLHLVEGEVFLPGNAWLVEEKGIFAGPLLLPGALRLDRVLPEFWDTDDVKQVTTNVRFVDPQGRFERFSLAINRTIRYHGLRMYQSQNFGNAFFLEIRGTKAGTLRRILQLQNPPDRRSAGYGNYQLPGVPYLLKAKYYADAGKTSMNSRDPLLVLRLVEGKKMVNELSLKTKEAGRLGPFTVQLTDVSRWAGIIVVENTGMPAVFLGFFVIIMGAALTYGTPPREITVAKDGTKLTLSWYARRFEPFYQDEFNAIVEACDGEKPA